MPPLTKLKPARLGAQSKVEEADQKAKQKPSWGEQDSLDFGDARSVVESGPLHSRFGVSPPPAWGKSDPRNSPHRLQLVKEIYTTDAQTADALAFLPKAMVQSALPYRRAVDENGNPKTIFHRRTPNLDFTIATHRPDIGIPCGPIPRILIALLTDVAKRYKTRYIDLGESISALLTQCGMQVTGGRNGSITRLRTQLDALRYSSILIDWKKKIISHNNELLGTLQRDALFPIIDEAVIWESKSNTALIPPSKYYLKLSEYFYNEIVTSSVPIDLRALFALQRSPLAMDLYCFFTYRVSYLTRPLNLSWEMLQSQFGVDYIRTADFRRRLEVALKKVLTVYPTLRVDVGQNGIIVHPSPTHVGRGRSGPMRFERNGAKPGLKIDASVDGFEDLKENKPKKAEKPKAPKAKRLKALAGDFEDDAPAKKVPPAEAIANAAPIFTAPAKKKTGKTGEA